jgi:glycosyltransferase involved in cell wall biosynthesis/predicted O-methyltransferase YrrM
MIKHILLSTTDPGVGGVAQYNHSILCFLIKKGYRVTCLQPQNDHEKIVYQKSLGIHHIWCNGSQEKEFKEVLTSLEYKPDLLICSNTNPFSNFSTKRVCIQLGIPYIVVEGLVEPCLANQFSSYIDELAEHYAKAKSVIAVSHNNLDLLRELFGLPKCKGKVIHYGRPRHYFTPCDLSIRKELRETLSIPDDAIVCFTAARIESRKGYQYQLEAIRQLMKTAVWPQLYFVWAGGGIFEPQLETHLRQVVEQLGIADKVKFLGQQSNVLEWLNIADIFILPAQLEGMPLSVMEAMAKGLPVIATSVSGIPEELGSTGKLVSDPNSNSQSTVRELVKAIQDWSVSPTLRMSVGQACKQRAEVMFQEERMLEQTLKIIEGALLPIRDYVSPGLSIIQPDYAFPEMVAGNPSTCAWPYLRRDIPHNWYVDRRQPTIGFLSRDEAHILYNTALKFEGKKGLEIGCWLGWSACHIALAGVELDVVDPVLGRPEIFESVSTSLERAGVLNTVNLVAGYSPQKVEELAVQLQRKWPFIFIDGNHEAPGPLEDAIICEQLAEEDAVIVFHDLTSPDVSQGLDYLKHKGWNTMIYQTMQIMGVAWRGEVEPVMHQPDPEVDWTLPEHLKQHAVSGFSHQLATDEFQQILSIIRPYTLLSEARLFSLYSLAKQICLEDIPGSFVECGTYKGGAAALLATVIQRYSLRPRLLYAFDTFEGMPDPIEVDRHDGIPANLTGFGVGTLKAPIEENLNKVCQELGVTDIVVPVKGLFADTLPEYKLHINDIALLHADGDWYESTMDIFNTLYECIVPDGVIQVDDYGHWEGCRKALHEFEALQNEKFNLTKIDDTGVWFQKFTKAKTGKPTIVVDGVFFQLYKTGIARVWKSVLEEWSTQSFAQNIVVLDRAGTVPKIPNIRYRLVPAYSYSETELDRQMLQQVCDEEGADLFISTYYTTPIATPSVFMAYDMIPEVLGANLQDPMWREKQLAIQHASAYIAISENTTHDLCSFYSDVPLEAVTVAHCGVQPSFSPSSTVEINAFKLKYGISKPYFLLVGGGAGYKNSLLFFQAFAQLPSKQGFDIVCTGSNSLLDTDFRTYTAGVTVHMLRLDDDELRVAYSGAIALAYPSLYEGFGLPIVEAMASGCPVITCPNASIPEVAGDAALYVDDNDATALANALCEVQKPEVRQALIEMGLEQAAKFSWSAMANKISSALITATLTPLNLREINLLIFPDWSQPEEMLYSELGAVIQAIAYRPDKSQITLLVNMSNISEEEANLALSGLTMTLLLQEEELDVTEGPEISLVGGLSSIQWQVLLTRVQSRLPLEHEDQQAIAAVGAGNLAISNLETLEQHLT